MKKIKILSIWMAIIISLMSLFGCNQIGYDYTFYNTIDSGNLEQVKEYIKDGKNINEMNVKSSLESNPFKLALKKDKKKIAEYFIENGVDVNFNCRTGETLLMFCAYKCDYKFCDLLIKNGADINKVSDKGINNVYTAIDEALIADKDESEINRVINLLFDNGAKLTEKSLEAVMSTSNNEGYRRYGLVRRIVEEMKKQGVNYVLDSAYEAAILGDAEKLNQLIKDNKIEEKYEKQMIPFIFAFGKADSLKLLEEKGINIELHDDKNKPAFSIAAEYGNLEMMEYLLNKGCKLEECYGKGIDNALIFAVKNNQYEAAKYILKKEVKLSEHYHDAVTKKAFCAASINGNIDMMKLILDNGCKVNDENMGLAMDGAVTSNKVDSIKYIIKIGANPNYKYNENTPLNKACLLGNLEIVKTLVESGASINSNIDGKVPLTMAANEGHIEIVKYLIEKGADVNFVASSDLEEADSPLYGAIYNGYLDIVKLLVENGADINRGTKKGNNDTPIITAALSGSRNILNYLIDKGADVNYVNKEGQNALMVASKYGLEYNAKILIDFTEDISLKDNNGKTATDLAKDKLKSAVNDLLE